MAAAPQVQTSHKGTKGLSGEAMKCLAELEDICKLARLGTTRMACPGLASPLPACSNKAEMAIGKCEAAHVLMVLRHVIKYKHISTFTDMLFLLLPFSAKRRESFQDL